MLMVESVEKGSAHRPVDSGRSKSALPLGCTSDPKSEGMLDPTSFSMMMDRICHTVGEKCKAASFFGKGRD